MTSSPPDYSPLPTSPTPPEKPPLTRTSSAAPATQDHSLRTRRALLFLAGALTVIVLGSSGYAATVGMSCPRKDRSGDLSRHHGHGDAHGVRGGMVKRDEPVASPTFSTSVYEDGQTSTFVYTTRPIVNPGGFTIGTLTAYVLAPTETTTLPLSPTTTSEQPATTSAPATTSSPTSLPCTTSTRPTKRPIFTESTIPSTLSPSPTSESTPTETLEARDFAEVDLHLLHRRGLNFEDSPPEDLSTILPSAAEYSTSINKHGETDIYVKTTRPILNPAGFTIGTLDGVYVRAPQATLPPQAKGAKDPSRPKRVLHHEELRKRGEEE